MLPVVAARLLRFAICVDVTFSVPLLMYLTPDTWVVSYEANSIAGVATVGVVPAL